MQIPFVQFDHPKHLAPQIDLSDKYDISAAILYFRGDGDGRGALVTRNAHIEVRVGNVDVFGGGKIGANDVVGATGATGPLQRAAKHMKEIVSVLFAQYTYKLKTVFKAAFSC